jgi:hypothetical protein
LVDKPRRRREQKAKWRIPVTIVVVTLLVVAGAYYLWPRQSVLPPQNSVKEYANEVIACYTDLVTVHYSLNPDFSSLKPYFRLYNDSAHSFKVLVMPAYPSNVSNTVALIFQPINASKTDFLFDYGDTFEQLYEGNEISAYRFVIPGGTFDYGGNPAQFNLAFSAFPIDITGNTTANANSEALSLFNSDASKLPSYAMTVTQAGVCPISIGNGLGQLGDFLNWLNNNTVSRTIVTVFGSLLAFVIVVVIAVVAVWQRRFIEEMLETIHLRKEPPDKESNNAEDEEEKQGYDEEGTHPAICHPRCFPSFLISS